MPLLSASHHCPDGNISSGNCGHCSYRPSSSPQAFPVWIPVRQPPPPPPAPPTPGASLRELGPSKEGWGGWFPPPREKGMEGLRPLVLAPCALFPPPRWHGEPGRRVSKVRVRQSLHPQLAPSWEGSHPAALGPLPLPPASLGTPSWILPGTLSCLSSAWVGS